MKEWTRTILLVVLLAACVAFLLWTRHAAETSLINGIR